ncbi:MAG: FAD-dependent oxidoreductase [Verrucomicrobiales bacterium]|nr:FAD-dependent oxidoreductase [Verrucomicrobiales bacterium]
MTKRPTITALLLSILCSITAFAQQQVPQTISESSRKIPLAYDVDVIVVGGTTRGVAAAVAAAEQGASVFLAASRPYLGVDMCATYRLWLEQGEVPNSPLGKAIFANASTHQPPAPLRPGLPFTYTSNIPASPKHAESKKNDRLSDGQRQSASSDSLQYDGDVTLIVDLGEKRDVARLVLTSFQRPRDFAIGEMGIAISDNREQWKKLPSTVNKSIDGSGDSTKDLIASVNATTRYIQLTLSQDKDSKRMLLAELHIEDASAPAPKNSSVATKNLLKVTTPMQVKGSLDTALLNAKVDFLYGSYLGDIIRDDQGQIAGITIVNRSGRQAVRAKVIIDATDRAVVARLAGAEFTSYPAGPQSFKRIVLGGEAGQDAQKLNVNFSIGDQIVEAYEYDLKLPMQDSSWASFAKADQQARNLSWQNNQFAAAEKLYQVPPDSLKARASQNDAWSGAEQINLDTLRPEKVAGIYVLGGCAAISREAAASLLRPLAGIDLGSLVGKAAAADAKKITLGKTNTLHVSGLPIAGAKKAVVGEMLQGLRSMPSLTKNTTINNPARGIPIIARYDTVVVGGGTGGAPAGVGAARGGAKTLVLEYLYGLGGVGTIGRISKYYHGNRVGFTAEIDKGVESYDPGAKSNKGWNIEHKMEWLRSEIVKAGGDVWFRTLGAGAIMDGDRCIGVIVATPHGRYAILANTVIDATGNAVIPASAGMETQAITGEHISVQGTGLPPMTPGESYLNSDWTFVDDDDVLDMWRIHVVGKRKYADAFDLGQLIDTRARRRIVGDLVISPMDIINNRTYPDIITVSKSNFDNHGFSSHSLFMITPPDKKGLTGNVPYRALMPKGKDGLLVTGLGMSAHGDAMPVMRMQADVQNQGYAAGKASAMAAENSTTIRHIDIKELQKHLVDQDIIPVNLLTTGDSYPISPAVMQDAIKTLGKDYQGIAIILTDPKVARPLLRKAWQNADKEDEKLRYAHVLGMLYDDAGASSLITAIEKSEWDEGWNFRGMGQFGASTSPLDNLIIALGRTRDPAGLPCIIDKLKALTPESEFSHVRAISIALENYRSPAAAQPLAELLAKPGISGHVFLEINNVIDRSPKSTVDNTTRNDSLRELLLIRALYRCGDYKGVAQKALQAYSNDLRGLYARHATSILSENHAAN